MQPFPGRVSRRAALWLAAASLLWAFAPAFAASPRVHALVGARIVLAPGRVIERGTIVLRDGLIEAVGANTALPPDARIWPADSLTIYPGFIDPYLRLSRLRGKEPPAASAADEDEAPPTEQPSPGARSAIARVHPEFVLTSDLAPAPEWWAPYHALGFTAAYVVPDSGIFRGRGALLNLRPGRASECEVPAPPLQCIGYDAGHPGDDYPRSLMGVIAVIRQTLLDARRHAEALRIYALRPAGQERPVADLSLEALEPALARKQRVLFEDADVLSVLRSVGLAREFGLQALALGSGGEYKDLGAVAGGNIPLILPLAFPEPPAFDTPEEALRISTRALREWDCAPSNPARCESAGIVFAFTTDRLRDPALFRRRLRAALARGLSAEKALAALTVEPARMLQVQDRLGTLEPGKIANLVVADGDLIRGEGRVRQVWIDGMPIAVPLEDDARKDARGLWRLEPFPRPASAAGERGAPAAPGPALWLCVWGGKDSLRAAITIDGSGSFGRLRPGRHVAERVECVHDTLRAFFPRNSVRSNTLPPQRILLRDSFGEEKQGWVAAGPGEFLDVRAVRASGPPSDEDSPEPEPETPQANPPGPLASPPAMVIRGATLWTCATAGVLRGADVLVQNGKISAIGPGLSAPGGALVVDGGGLHVTPGIIDSHCHIAVSGDINEGTHSSTAEVRIADVINPETPDLYRQLAGGVTTVQILHGSANVIGGQGAVIKLRAGRDAGGLLFLQAPPAIKFALGENVTQKSWGERFNKRYPQTRMGVEEFFRERFDAALDYGRKWSEYRALPSGRRERTIPPRSDLELEALGEVLRGERLVHCHAYRGDEMLAMMRVAEDYGFRVASFEHALEAYKVAPEMAAHRAGACLASDWWAYKPEAYDAIPYNAALLYASGVRCDFCSDSPELARRLNLEAAKAVKYGGVPEEEALRMVTLNPAALLGVDRFVGTLEVGKDADLAVWNGSPLSSGSICVQTWIEGVKYFDREADLAARPARDAERAALLAKARRAAEAAKGSEKKRPQKNGRPVEAGGGAR